MRRLMNTSASLRCFYIDWLCN